MQRFKIAGISSALLKPSTITSTFSATSHPATRSATSERRRSGRGKPRPPPDRNRTSKTSRHSIRLVIPTPEAARSGLILEGQRQARLHLKFNDPGSHEWGPIQWRRALAAPAAA
jgi:hypothetical protein